jgi:RecB family exonuclease
MSLILDMPQPRPTIAPAPRMTNARFWRDFQPEHLRAIRDKLGMVIDAKDRGGEAFEPEVAAEAASAVATTAKNETLGDILSPSQANLFLNCSARWWFKYGLGLPDPKGGSLVRGSTVHKCIEHWFKLRMAGAEPEIEEVAEFFDDAWEAQAADAQFANTDDIEDLKRSGARLLRLYLEQVAPEIRPVKLEQKVTGEVGGVRVQGWIDQVDSDGRILDVKTAEKSPSGISGDYAFQLATYRQILPGANGRARLDTLVNNKAPKLVTIEYEVSEADRLLTLNLYPRVREGIREGLYFPNRNSNLCSRKYCNFADACCKEFGGCVE